MLDLRQKLKGARDHLQAFLAKSRRDGKKLGILFYHTHPNYGQSHLYIAEDASIEPEENLLGEIIDDVIDYEGWTESTTWWGGESDDGKLELIRLNGESVQIENNDQFNVIWAEDIESMIRDSCPSIDADLIPERIVVCAESGEYRADWRTNPGPNKAE